MNYIEELEKLVRECGSKSAFCRRLGTSRNSLWRWLNGCKIPAELKLYLRDRGEKEILRARIKELEEVIRKCNTRDTR